MHIHLDAVGGIAGDMFVAAMLDAWPDLTPRVEQNLRLAGLDGDVRVALRPHDDGVLTGRRFDVTKEGVSAETRPDSSAHGHDHHDHEHRHDHSHHHHHHHHDGHAHHDHTHWRDLRASLERSHLPEDVKQAAIGIFSRLAEAEATVHGKAVEDVAFHEVGNWDSIADIVAAATLIVAVGATSWSVNSLPVGRGFVQTQHGRLPVPAPATTLLLRGFAFHDDGRQGERITPTGAAILRYIAPTSGLGSGPRLLDRTGIGFGTKRFEGMSNVLRILAFTSEKAAEDQVGVLQFEIDDQSGEELAVALDYLRATDGVIDVIQTPAFGKKGRMLVSVQILTRPEAIEPVSAICFQQTTTLGLRSRIEKRSVLPRQSVTTADGVRVKIAYRPGGLTAKAEIDDIRERGESHKARADTRHCAETLALETKS
ncbi:LarC family nickel insertion protein (plasmid) [Rhizobium sp. CB3090]|uniref:LarC family nickel insertion protein n=1 Tax=Rhizobium sp. CB3090 TaxID=3039156 RepID=UPI0024B24037|nr:LarC family nickel insertion protein [Rhizobium sp. CB3090]WFU11869.1 LarC family nickel insertion protein [Rhizobium sp. CB3090]